MKRIILHWTGGKGYPNDVDKEHYHYLIDCEGVLYRGKYHPEDNLNCNDGKYAKHTGGGNTGSIGVALCGMLSYPDTRKNTLPYTDFPLTKIQCETTFNFIAGLCIKYNIKPSEDTIMTHYEFGNKNPHSGSSGKIDIIYLPPYDHVKKDNIGDFIRSKIIWYYNKRLSLKT